MISRSVAQNVVDFNLGHKKYCDRVNTQVPLSYLMLGAGTQVILSVPTYRILRIENINFIGKNDKVRSSKIHIVDRCWKLGKYSLDNWRSYRRDASSQSAWNML